MARFRYKHIQSTVEDKIPSDLLDGELAVNRFKGKERIFLKNANNEIISFSSDSLINKELENKASVSDFSAHTANTEIHVTSADKTTWNAKVDASAIANFFDDAKYEDSGTTKVINFYHGNTIKATIDASDFIVDGMVDDVRIDNGYLVIDFNTDSGKQDISIPLTDIFDPSNYYNKTEIDDLVGSGFTSSSITDVIIENEEIVSAALTDLDERKLDISAYTPSDLSNYYTKSETSGATELSTAFDSKLDSSIYSVFSAATNESITQINSSITDLSGQSETVAAALNYLNENKADLSAITPVDLSNYYTKSETSGVTELSTAFGGKLDVSAYTPTDLSNYYTKSETSGATEIQTALSNKADTATTLGGYGITDAYTKSETSGATEISNALEGKVNTSDIISAITPSNSGSTNPIATSVVAENELTVSNALTDLDERKLDASAYTPVDMSNYYTKLETSGATELATAFDAKLDSSIYSVFSAATNESITQINSSITDLSGQSETVSVALNYLNENKADLSAVTHVDLSNYYTKSETSGATEISNALSGKVNSATFTGHTADTAMHFTTTEKTNLDSLATNIAVISGITSTKVGNWDTAYTNNHTHSNKTALDSITGAVGTMAYQDASSYSSATQVNTALEGKVNTSEYATFSAETNTSINDLSGQCETILEEFNKQSETVAAALNVLNERITQLEEQLSSLTNN